VKNKKKALAIKVLKNQSKEITPHTAMFILRSLGYSEEQIKSLISEKTTKNINVSKLLEKAFEKNFSVKETVDLLQKFGVLKEKRFKK
jgi:Holliday junction resolvasome RuvABC DNA-binding subunit